MPALHFGSGQWRANRGAGESGAGESGIFIGSGGGRPIELVLRRANRHGLIAGATGMGKTVTLQGIVEGLSAAGVPSFVADVKGDLSGLAMAGSPMGKLHETFDAHAAETGDAGWSYADNPVQFWDLFGAAIRRSRWWATASPRRRCSAGSCSSSRWWRCSTAARARRSRRQGERAGAATTSAPAAT